MLLQQCLHQSYTESLGHASYLLDSAETKEALVFDVRRDADVYLAAARERGLRIGCAVDTHRHNDYLTGITELPGRGPVQLLSSARASLGCSTRPLADGERVALGEIVLGAMRTPGHTPEDIAVLVTDRARSDEPSLLLAGGALLVGDVGRPDCSGMKRTSAAPPRPSAARWGSGSSSAAWRAAWLRGSRRSFGAVLILF